MTSSPLVSIVIRSRNEARWIWRCLRAIESQTLQPVEVVLVDNQSTDETVSIAMTHGVTKVVRLEEYSPGKAINLGVSQCTGEYVVLLSAHCVPSNGNWLELLVSSLESDDNLAACYGRQLPLPFTHPSDKADLLAVFRPESRLQQSDGYMNNANSIIRRSVWQDLKFDEEVTNVEDRVWGDKVISLGYRLKYVAQAEVFHYNGLHRTTSRQDQAPTVRVLEASLASESMPDTSLYEEIFHKSFLPILLSNVTSNIDLQNEIDNLRGITAQEMWLEPLVISELEDPSLQVRSRSSLGLTEETPVDQVLVAVAKAICSSTPQAQYLGLFIAKMGFPTQEQLQALVAGIVRENADFSFLARREYRHIWFRDDGGNFIQIDDQFSKKSERREAYVARYGEGSIFSMASCISSNIFEGLPAVVIK